MSNMCLKATEGCAGSQAHKENMKVMRRRPKAFLWKQKELKMLYRSLLVLVSNPAPQQD